MESFEECGWASYAALGMSGFALFVAVVALSLSVAKPRVGGVMSLLALALSLGPAGVGVAGTVWGKSRVDAVVSSGVVEPALAERIRQQGYAEAGACTTIGLGASAPPVLVAGLALVIALVRRRSAGAEP